MSAILLSVRPVFARAIMAGTKTAEVRRRFPHQPVGSTIFIYSTTPDRAVLGTVRLGAIDRPDSEDVWGLYRDQIKIDRVALNSYLDEAASAAILHLSEPDPWHSPISLATLRRLVEIEPPQSFRYLDDAQVETLLDFAYARESLGRQYDGSLTAAI